nr:MAG TPA: Nitrile hydratase beta subunit [Caudoviricetes sp.]
MKFKVGDKVRVTREGLTKQAESSFVKSYEIS